MAENDFKFSFTAPVLVNYNSAQGAYGTPASLSLTNLLQDDVTGTPVDFSTLGLLIVDNFGAPANMVMSGLFTGIFFDANIIHYGDRGDIISDSITIANGTIARPRTNNTSILFTGKREDISEATASGNMGVSDSSQTVLNTDAANPIKLLLPTSAPTGICFKFARSSNETFIVETQASDTIVFSTGIAKGIELENLSSSISLVSNGNSKWIAFLEKEVSRNSVPPGASPSGLSGLTIWLDASDSLTTPTGAGGDLTSWDDLSAGGNDFTPPGNAPSLTVAAQNGLNAVQFDETNQEYLTLGSAPITAPPWTVIIACKVETDLSADRTFYSFCDTAGFVDYNLIKQNITDGGLQLNTYDNSVSAVCQTPNGFVVNQAAIAFIQSTSSSSRKCRLDFSTEATDTDTSAPAGVDQTAIGALVRSVIGNYWEGQIFEVIVFDRILTATEIQNIHFYLANKWDISI